MTKPQTYEVTASYTRQYDDPIVATKGERVAAGKRETWSTDPDSWVWCTGAAGKSGWVPEAFLEIEGDTAIFQRDYSALELSVTVGERLTGFEQAAGWVWSENAAGARGWVPLDNVRAID